MATEVLVPDTTDVTAYRISWGAIFAGAVSALASWALLYVLGLAIGLSTVETGEGGNLRATGMFTGIWGAVSPLIALFIGGLVAGRASGTYGRGTGALHGFVTWGFTMLVGAGLGAPLLASLAGGLLSAGTSLNVGGKAMWGIFVALVLGLIAAVIGGLSGVRRRARHEVIGPTPTRVVRPTPPPLGGREVYP